MIENNKTKNTSIEFAYIILGIIVFSSIVFIFPNWKEKTQTIKEKDEFTTTNSNFKNDLIHCQKVVNSNVIDFNNREFQRCDKLLYSVVDGVNQSR